ncbi:type II toxin-antitoxin system VapC family toxin [Halovivax limisalsi]|uniref:type II toxin-antitoxin system VapC family toxin n=1 Tax=Halovivax limisalsi TaxID=1453760 RepID=UPI001FFD0F08|nr:type II toxin-antitoxin system VapC family toxin [Halovivax limisalsi]
MKICDTSVLVDIDRGGSEIERQVEKLDDEGPHAVSTVTVTELRLGVHLSDSDLENRITKLDRLLSRFELVDVSRPVAVAAADIIATLKEQGRSLNDLHDVYIGATARVEQLPVLTANVSHFQRIEDVTAVDWNEY